MNPVNYCISGVLFSLIIVLYFINFGQNNTARDAKTKSSTKATAETFTTADTGYQAVGNSYDAVGAAHQERAGRESGTRSRQ
ncbi:hypothetical protein PbJCM13498_16600 [Prolixibacter bellariivorans]|uniref:Uncharacterized protein n=1 Tax=Prolixibacter bellariivorans TaxID=314319 RepID=A0A5M4AZF6_9BACT|nr:hypothetical protein PbJCM13498_16600 [Prolixibacter bellariivorans]